MPRRSKRAEPPQKVTGGTGRGFPVPLAIAWVIGFALLFFSQQLSSSQGVSRLNVLLLLPELLFEKLAGDEPNVPSGWRYLPQRLDLIAVAAFIISGAWSLGSLILRVILSGSDGSGFLTSRVERATLACGVGLAVWSLLTLAFGLVGWLSQPLFIVVLIAAVGGEGVMFFWKRREEPHIGPDTAGLSGGVLVFAGLASTPFLFAAMLGSMLPPIDFDVKEYHLGGPKEWYLNGQIEFLPHNVYTSFPFLTEMLSLSAMVIRGDWFRGALAGQLVLSVFLPLTGAAVFAIGRRLFGMPAGLLGAVVYMTAPWSYRIAVVAYAEGGLSFYLAAALIAAVIAIEAARVGSSSRATLLAGLFAGSAMACKYPGIVQVVIPIGIALVAATWMFSGRNYRDSAISRTVIAYTIGVAVAVGPWLLKNTFETGNPVYPLLGSVFDSRDWDAELNAKWKDAHSPPNYDPIAFVENIADVTVRSDWQSVLVFAFAPLAILSSHRRAARWIWLYVAYLYVAWWLLTHRIDRFWVPLMPVACVLAGGGMTWPINQERRASEPAAGGKSPGAWILVCGGLFVAAVLFNMVFLLPPQPAGVGFLADMNAAQERAATPNLQSLNRMLPADAKVLLVGEAEIFDARFPLVYSTVFDRNIFEQWTAEPRSGHDPDEWPLRSIDQIRKEFQSNGITHVYVNWREILRYRTTYGYSAFVVPARFAELQERGLLGDPATLRTVPFAVLDAAEQEEALSRFEPLVRRRGDDRILITAEVYEVHSP